MHLHVSSAPQRRSLISASPRCDCLTLSLRMPAALARPHRAVDHRRNCEWQPGTHAVYGLTGTPSISSGLDKLRFVFLNLRCPGASLGATRYGSIGEEAGGAYPIPGKIKVGTIRACNRHSPRQTALACQRHRMRHSEVRSEITVDDVVAPSGLDKICYLLELCLDGCRVGIVVLPHVP